MRAVYILSRQVNIYVDLQLPRVFSIYNHKYYYQFLSISYNSADLSFASQGVSFLGGRECGVAIVEFGSSIGRPASRSARQERSEPLGLGGRGGR